MTIAVAWVRSFEGGAQELVICSDSRLSGGKRFDHCQKTFRFTRSDAVICFAGGAGWAYPMVISTINAANIHTPSNTRALSLVKFKTHLLNILDLMQREVHTFERGEDVPDTTFLFGGYDWHQKSFRIWKIVFDGADRRFRAHERTGSNTFGGMGKIEFAGDPEWIEVFRGNLKIRVQAKFGRDMRTPDTARFDQEPFETLRDMLLATLPHDSIGGAPQGVKVYQFLNSADIGFFWPGLDGRVFLAGRPLLDYERAEIRSIIDVATTNSTWCVGNTTAAAAQLRLANDNHDRRLRGDDDPGEPVIPDTEND